MRRAPELPFKSSTSPALGPSEWVYYRLVVFTMDAMYADICWAAVQRTQMNCIGQELFGVVHTRSIRALIVWRESHDCVTGNCDVAPQSRCIVNHCTVH